jgi:pimeloyl-ACP methyl ester carboxylesterase
MTFPAIKTVRTPNGTLAYRVAGNGPPLVLIHGWGGSSRHWMGAYFTLTQTHTVYAIDLPGFGESTPLDPTNLEGLARSTIILIEMLGLQRYSLIGHSLGAAVAMLIAATFPQRIERVALVSFGLPRTEQEEIAFQALHQQSQLTAGIWGPWFNLWRPWLLATRGIRQMAWTTPPWPSILAGSVVRTPTDTASIALGIADMAAMDARAAIESASSIGSPLVSAAATRLYAPTLVISGSEDPLIPASSVQALSQKLPLGLLRLMDGCGHVPMAEQPGLFYGSLAAFLTMPVNESETSTA